MRLKALIQSFVAVVFGLGFIAFGIVAFIRTDNLQQRFESKLQSIQAGTVQPEMLTVVKKYVDPGRGAYAHVIFSSDRQPKVNISATVDFFNSVNLGDTVPGYYFPDGYFFPQNHRGDAGTGKWFFLGLGVLVGTGVLVLAVMSARRKTPNMDMDSLRKTLRDRMDGK